MSTKSQYRVGLASERLSVAHFHRPKPAHCCVRPPFSRFGISPDRRREAGEG